jgi:hypothetical protein
MDRRKTVGPRSGVRRRNLLPSVAVASTLIVCKGLLYGTALLAIIGITVDIPPGPWAIAVDVVVILAVVAFWYSRRRHGNMWPTIMAAAGAVLVVSRMHGPVPAAFEWAGLVLLVSAALLDWKVGRTRTAS